MTLQDYTATFRRGSIEREAHLRHLANENTKTQLQAVDDAHAILCKVCIHFAPYMGWNLWREYREWQNYRKALRVSDYLWSRPSWEQNSEHRVTWNPKDNRQNEPTN